MEASAHRCLAGNGGPLAPNRLSAVLETDFESEEAERKKADAEGNSGVDLPNGW
jgi:hypothetical protein